MSLGVHQHLDRLRLAWIDEATGATHAVARAEALLRKLEADLYVNLLAVAPGETIGRGVEAFAG